MATQDKVEFPGHDGALLAARFDAPAGTPRGTVLFAHCFSCSKDVLAAARIARTLVQEGFGVLRFDFTGLGLSHGDFANTSFSTNVADLLAAARWLNEHHGGPDLLIGHSLGGAAAILAARELEQVKAVATIGAPAHADHVLRAIGADGVARIEAEGRAAIALDGRSFTLTRQFLDDVRGAKVMAAAHALGRPILILHAPLDPIVGIDNATELFTAARHPKSFISLDDADHLLTGPGEAAHAGRAIAGWATRYVPETRFGPVPSAPSGVRDVLVSEAHGQPYTNWVVTARGHAFLADEPEIAGGRDLGADPYALLCASLAACTSITLRMLADRKGFGVRHIEVLVSYAREHLDDCEGCDANTLGHVFRRTLRLQGDLSEAQRQRLLELADKCPVHRTLTQSSRIETRLA